MGIEKITQGVGKTKSDVIFQFQHIIIAVFGLIFPYKKSLKNGFQPIFQTA